VNGTGCAALETNRADLITQRRLAATAEWIKSGARPVISQAARALSSSRPWPEALNWR
jgi:hypothetical protein